MYLVLGQTKHKLSSATLTLALNSVPRLRLELKSGLDNSLAQNILINEQEASLDWQDQSLNLTPYAYQQTSSNEAYIDAILVSETLDSWFQSKAEAPFDLNYGIYQNQSTAGGWLFLNSTFSQQFVTPAKHYKAQLNKLLPIGSCLHRPINQDNQNYLEATVEALKHHLTELAGWNAIHAEKEALRLVFFDPGNTFKLNNTWTALNANYPNRYTPESPTQIRTTGFTIKKDKHMTLLMALAKHGLSTPLEDQLESQNEKDLISQIGTVQLGVKYYLSSKNSYHFEETSHTLTVTLDLESGYQSPRSTPAPIPLQGHFQSWDTDDKNQQRVYLAPPNPPTWNLMDNQNPSQVNPKGKLLATFITPTTPNDSYAGIYVTHKENDQIGFFSQTFASPTILGGTQRYQEELEKANLSLNEARLALSTSSQGTNLDGTTGTVMTKAAMMNRADTDIKAEAETITENNNMRIMEDKVDVASDTDVAKNVQIDGKLEVGGL